MAWLCCGILFLLLALALGYIVQMKRALRALTAQLAALACGESEKMLDLALIDRDLEQLAALFNRFNARQRQAVAQARRHEAAQKDMIAGISHDLRTPLTVILGHLQLLEQSPLDEDAQVRVAVISGKAQAMNALVDRFYELSLLESETPTLTQVNLSRLLLNLLAEQAPALEARGLAVNVELPEQTIFVQSDGVMLERMLQNLLTNASRYAMDQVHIRLSQTQGATIFSVANPVAAPARIDPARLFDRFYTADPARANGATGVGLAVVKLLADRLSAEITADLDGDVLTMTLCLPVRNFQNKR